MRIPACVQSFYLFQSELELDDARFLAEAEARLVLKGDAAVNEFHAVEAVVAEEVVAVEVCPLHLRRDLSGGRDCN